MANLKDLLVNGPSNLIGDVTVNKIRLTSLEIPTDSNGTEYGTGSNGKILKSNGTSVYWSDDNNSITGVKGNTENSYRTGNVNITQANIIGSSAIGTNATPIYWNGSAFSAGRVTFDSLTGNRLVWTTELNKIYAGYHYADSEHIGIKSTSQPSQTFYVNGSTGLNGNLFFTSAGHITWNNGNYQQRIYLTDDSTSNTPVFTFQQSSDAGNNWTNLMTIKDNGSIIATTFVGDLTGNAATVNKIRLTSLEVNNGTTYDPGSNGQVLKSNGTSIYWANDNNTTSFTITANATDGLWDLTGTNGTNSVTYALAPYSSKQTTASFYTGTTAPSLSTRLNYDGYLYAKKLYSDGAETITKNGGTINNSLTLQKSSTSADSPELIFNGQAGNSNAYKWSIQKNSSGDLIFSKINSSNTSTTTIVFSADGYLLPNTTDTYDLGSSSKKWRNIYGNLIGNADTATKLATARNLQVALGSTIAVTFDGSANQNSIPVSGILGVANGGTGATSFTGNRLIFSPTSTTFENAAKIYVKNETNADAYMAINKTSITSGYNFEVNGMSYLAGEVITDGTISPVENGIYDLGTEDYRWNKIYVNKFDPDVFLQNINVTLSSTWQNIQNNGADIELPYDGTYIIQIYDNTTSVGHYQTYWSGIFSWYTGNISGITNSNGYEYSEIPLHGSGQAINAKNIYLRTYSQNSSKMRLQIKGNNNLTSSTSNVISIKFKFIM